MPITFSILSHGSFFVTQSVYPCDDEIVRVTNRVSHGSFFVTKKLGVSERTLISVTNRVSHGSFFVTQSVYLYPMYLVNLSVSYLTDRSLSLNG